MPISGNWTTPNDHPALHRGEVHVWRASLECEPDVLRRFETTLCAAEAARAARFHFPRDRNYFIAGRGILRTLLGSYLRRPPESLKFIYGPQDKPALEIQDPSSPVNFNLSHSYGLAVYAFALGREVGIDVELIRPEFTGNDIAERYFSPRELAELRALPQDLRAAGFFNCWTRKEAYVKARGEGLQIPLKDFDVSLTPGKPAKLESADSSRWSLRSFEPAPSYIAAAIAEGKDWKLCHWDWTPRNHSS
jgi:4'-phosphopantetheinyl transferase